MADRARWVRRVLLMLSTFLLMELDLAQGELRLWQLTSDVRITEIAGWGGGSLMGAIAEYQWQCGVAGVFVAWNTTRRVWTVKGGDGGLATEAVVLRTVCCAFEFWEVR